MARTKGARGRFSAEIKQEIVRAFYRLGGTDAFTKWAKQHETDFYKIYASLAPKELTVDARISEVTDLSDAELATIATGSRAGDPVAPSSPEEPAPVH